MSEDLTRDETLIVRLRRFFSRQRKSRPAWTALDLIVHPDLIAVIDRVGEQMTLTRPEVLQKAVQLLALSCDRKFYVESPGEPDKIRELLIR